MCVCVGGGQNQELPWDCSKITLVRVNEKFSLFIDFLKIKIKKNKK